MAQRTVKLCATIRTIRCFKLSIRSPLHRARQASKSASKVQVPFLPRAGAAAMVAEVRWGQWDHSGRNREPRGWMSVHHSRSSQRCLLHSVAASSADWSDSHVQSVTGSSADRSRPNRPGGRLFLRPLLSVCCNAEVRCQWIDECCSLTAAVPVAASSSLLSPAPTPLDSSDSLSSAGSNSAQLSLAAMSSSGFFGGAAAGRQGE